MALAKLAVRLDGRFLLAAFGLAAAILVPLAGVLASTGLQARVDGRGESVRIAGEAGLPESTLDRAAWVLSGQDDAAGRHLVAYTKGVPRLAVGEAYDGGTAGRIVEVQGRELTTVAGPRGQVGPGLLLVHPSLLDAARPEVAGFTGSAPGSAVPARGGDAFEVAGIRELKGYTVALTVLSLPLVVLVAAAFARLEARGLATTVAVVAALGKPERAGQLLTARALLLAVCGGALALAATAGGVWLGLLPGDVRALAGRDIAFGVAAPAMAAALAGSAVGWVTVARTRAALRERPALGGEARLGWLPTAARPLVAGWHLVGVLVLVGAVVALDVGLPLAAAGVPAALAGSPGEWVLGAESDSITAGRARESAAHVMGLDPAIEDIVAEAFVPTVLEGKPFLLRGGSWREVAEYHGLRLVEGRPPGEARMVLGERAARTVGLGVGDAAYVVGEGGLLARLTVSGLYESTSPLLEDEGVLSLGDARRLANLPAGEVHAVRLRPQSPEALAAVGREAPRIEVLALRVEPAGAVAGTVAAAVADVVNLSGVPGTRQLDLRIGSEAVASTAARLQGYERREVAIPFIVPSGPYDLQVNPEASAVGQPARRSLESSGFAVVGQAVQVRLLDGGTPAPGVLLGVFANGSAVATAPPLATAQTDADGRATLPVPRSGLLVVAARQGEPAATEVYGVAPADAGRSSIVVEAATSDPPTPGPGQSATVTARVRNVGGVAGSERLELTAGGAARGYQDVHLGPGQATSVTFDYAPRRAGEAVAVDGVAVTRPTSARAPGTVIDAGEATPGEALQSDVADRLLGNARAVLGGLAVTAAVSAVAILLLATRRTLASRSGVVAVLATILPPDDIRRRAAIEGIVLGGLGGALGVLAAKGFFLALAQWTTVRAFGHALDDPFSFVFMVQVGGTTAFLTALTLYNGVGRRLTGDPGRALRSGGADG